MHHVERYLSIFFEMLLTTDTMFCYSALDMFQFFMHHPVYTLCFIKPSPCILLTYLPNID